MERTAGHTSVVSAIYMKDLLLRRIIDGKMKEHVRGPTSDPQTGLRNVPGARVAVDREYASAREDTGQGKEHLKLVESWIENLKDGLEIVDDMMDRLNRGLGMC